jgi:hypothetical protein
MSARLFAQIAGIDTTDPEQRTVLWRALGHAERTGFHVCRTCAVEIQNAACGYTDPAASPELSVKVQKLVPSL